MVLLDKCDKKWNQINQISQVAIHSDLTLPLSIPIYPPRTSQPTFFCNNNEHAIGGCRLIQFQVAMTMKHRETSRANNLSDLRLL